MKIVWALGLVLTFNAQAEKMVGNNTPFAFNRIMGTNTVLTFDQLPQASKVSDNRMVWSETYWPSHIGGIGYRWNHPDPQPFQYKLLSKLELMSMSSDQLAQLSPAELYDISQSDYTYTLTRSTRGLYSKADLWWEGICHGWAQAAINYPEPAPVVIQNKEGLKVPFGASDVKALLAMHDAYIGPGMFAQVGKKCHVRGKVEGENDSRDGNLPIPTAEELNSEDCRDVNAGAFHLIITNMIGIHGITFVADIDRLNDIWNQPIAGYSSRVEGEEPVSSEQQLAGITRRLRIVNEMTYGEELQIKTPEKLAAHPEWIHWVSKLPVTGTNMQQFRSKKYEYILELDMNGHVTGGEWISQTRPDFVWAKIRTGKFHNMVSKEGFSIPLAGLKSIYHPMK